METPSLSTTNPAAIVKTENGIDLLQRLATRPKLVGLQPQLFGENGPQPGDVIEVNEKGVCIKTIMLTQWIVRFILPSKWKECPIGGLGVGVILISTDHLFSILHLTSLMEKTVKRALRLCPYELGPGMGTAMMKEIVKNSLKRLFIYESFSKTELQFAFCSAKTFVLSHPDFSVIIIDSLSAFYWEDRLVSTTFQSLEKYCQTLLESLMERLRQTNMTIIYTVQQFLRDKEAASTSREANDPQQTTPLPPLFVYSITLEEGPDSDQVVRVEDRRSNTSITTKCVLSSKGELSFE